MWSGWSRKPKTMNALSELPDSSQLSRLASAWACSDDYTVVERIGPEGAPAYITEVRKYSKKFDDMATIRLTTNTGEKIWRTIQTLLVEIFKGRPFPSECAHPDVRKLRFELADDIKGPYYDSSRFSFWAWTSYERRIRFKEASSLSKEHFVFWCCYRCKAIVACQLYLWLSISETEHPKAFEKAKQMIDD